MVRRARHEGSLYRGADHRWHASVDLGIDAHGKRIRRHVSAKTQQEVKRKLDELKRDRDAGPRRARVRTPTVGEWRSTWLAAVERTRKPSTAKTYRTHCAYLDPIAKTRLDRVTTEAIEKIYGDLVRRGVKPISVHSAHRTFRSCFNEALKREWISRNPVKAARPDAAEEAEVEPFTVPEAQRILAAAQSQRNGARWAIALCLGLRQGEALGLQWDDINLGDGVLRVRRSLHHGVWRHGCEAPSGCAPRARNCPLRHGGGLIVTSPKSRRAVRTIPLPEQLQDQLRAHRAVQAAERLAAGELWAEPPRRGNLNSGTGWVFATAKGRPVDPRRDWDQWIGLIEAAGVRRARLHDARHTAATFLLVAGVDPRTVMDIMGWSQPVLLMRYQHVIDDLKREAAERMERLLWSSNERSLQRLK